MPKKSKNVNKNKNKNVNKNVVNIKIHNDTKKRRRSSKPKKVLQGNAPPTNGYASFSPQISVYPQLPQYPPQMVGGYFRDAMMPTQPNTLADFTIPRSQSMQTQIPSEIQTNNVETPITLSEKINEEFVSGFQTLEEPKPAFMTDPSPIAPPPFSSNDSIDVKQKKRNSEKPPTDKVFEERIDQLALQEFKNQLTPKEISKIKWSKKGLPKNKGIYGRKFNAIRAETKKQLLENDDDL